MRKQHWILFLLYMAAVVSVFIVALISPAFRSVAYAPGREWLLPPPEPVEVYLLYSTEKEEWLQHAIERFHASQSSIDGRPIRIVTEKSGSREMVLAVMDGSQQPDIISPASSLHMSILEDLSLARYGQSWVKYNDTKYCRSVVKTPLVLVSWEERAQVLWGDQPPQDMWVQLHDDLVGAEGWSAYGHADWGYIKFGHTTPAKSNSGLMTLVLMTYGYYGRSSGLTAQDILSNPDFQQWLIEFESTVTAFGDSTGTYMKEIVAYGPSMYDVVAVYESTMIEQAENATGRYGNLRVYYPPQTVMSDHPMCVMQTEWVEEIEARAAQQFIDFLLSEEMQRSALIDHGFRPALSSIALDQAQSPLLRYAHLGLQVQTPPEIEVPPGNVLNVLIDFWIRNVMP
jgi:ABC-type sulfate transport system substrate-binding protein